MHAGAFFSIFTTILVYMDYRFGGTKRSSEQVHAAALPCLALPLATHTSASAIGHHTCGDQHACRASQPLLASCSIALM